ncbi:MAG: hypothetical protein HYX23_01940 [Candidatus Zambryskibacteria bacterium]|nr:hypothetical protein [Candidatus Zambryskibacteria bacterium]
MKIYNLQFTPILSRVLDKVGTIYKKIALILLLIVGCLLFVSTPLGVQAQSVDLLWQGETYVPPFYQGRSLWSNQSRITFFAMTQGLGNPANLYYKWTKNGTVLGNINGVGKNTLSFTDSILSRPQIIRVDILSGENAVLASASVFAAPESPILDVYENNPLYGFMFHRGVDREYRFRDKETTFTAFPLFFSVSGRADNTISYEWRTNNGDVETKNSVTYRAPDNVAGASQIQVSASNKEKILQSGGKNFLIQFGKNNEQ